jgi:hypothetical protein
MHSLTVGGVFRWVSTHVRRYPALYAIAAAWIVMISVVPSVVPRGTTTAETIGDTSAPGDVVSGGKAVTGGPGGKARSVGGVVAGPGAGTTSLGPGSAPVAAVRKATGVTRAGFKCGPGVRQVPWSAYAPPCVAKFTGFNGGATYQGVDSKTIKIAVRVTVDQGGPASKTSDQLQQQAGGATQTQYFDYAQKLVGWFNKNYELYGRKVQLVKYNGRGNSIDEAQNKGQEGACADATTVATSVRAFAAVQHGFTEESGVFTDCAVRQHRMFMPLTAPYFPEHVFQKWHPYAWDNTMQCERIGLDLAEYAGKRLNNRKAKWAGDASLKAANRRFALYVPNDPNYLGCAKIFENEFKRKYGGTVVSQYHYALDVSQFPSEALRAVVQFQADRASTIILACDNISPTFLTQGAKQQGYHPEWLLIGVAGTDTDSAAASYDQEEVNGHLFGMSEIGNNAKLSSPSGEAARAWREATGQTKLPNLGPVTEYYNLVDIFALLQAAGPVLTPQHAATGARLLPDAGGAQGASGTWSWKHDHTTTLDEREISWNGSHYLESYGGRRFSSGQWPREEPPIYR